MRSQWRSVMIGLLGMFAVGPSPAQEARPVLPLQAAAKGHTARIHTGVFTPDSRTFVSAGLDRIIRGWNVADGKPLFTLPGHDAAVRALGLSGRREAGVHRN